MFGWCSDGNHKDCIKEYQRFLINERPTKKSPKLVILLDEWRKCDCKCHEKGKK